MFLVDADNPGLRVERLIPTMDRAFSGGHAEVDVRRLPRARGRGARRGRPRLSLRAGAPRAGAAHALHALARPRAACARHRARPGRRRARHSAGRCSSTAWCRRSWPTRVIDIEASRGLIRTLRRGARRRRPGTHESSVAKVFVVGGGRARRRPLAADLRRPRRLSDDLPLARYLAEVRAFRIYDGPSETHRWSIARRAVRRRQRGMTGPVDVVDTAEQAAALPLPPLLVRRPARGLAGRARPRLGCRSQRHASARATRTRRSSSSAASGAWCCVGRRARRCRRRRTTCCARRACCAASHDRARVPRVLAVCPDADVLGVPFYVMEELRGHVVTEELPGVARGAPTHAGAAGNDLVDALVELHAVDIESAGPGRFRPSRRLSRAPAEALHGALGAQRDARACRSWASSRRGSPQPCRRPATPASCTATTGSAT